MTSYFRLITAKNQAKDIYDWLELDMIFQEEEY